MSITPDTLALPVSKLTRSMIYNEFRFFHELAGGKRNISNLTSIYTFDVKDPTTARRLIDCVERYSALEQEMDRRREAEALWRKYVHDKGERTTAKLGDVAHYHGD